jgi:hypothetical protein
MIPQTSDRFLAALRSFADTVLERARDRWGEEPTPLFADGLDVKTGEPVRWTLKITWGGQTGRNSAD